MASNEVLVKLDAKDLVAKLEEAKELLSEARIRQIVREELQKWQRQQLMAIRASGPLSMETK